MRKLFRSLFGLNSTPITIDQLPTDPALQNAMANAVLAELIQERRNNRRWTIIKRIGFAAFFLVGLAFYVALQARSGGIHFIPSKPIVGIVRIEGSIMSTTLASADKIIPALEEAFERKNTQAIILAIDSPGGAPVESERINFVLDTLRKKTGKPVYAVMQNVGASAAYMIALHADKIYAGNYSMVGSVGAVLSAWQLDEAIAQYKVKQKVFASGSLKAMLNPFIPSTPEADAKAQDIVNIMGHRFRDELIAARGDKLKLDFKYDTGEIWDGAKSKEIGLIDEIGTIESVMTLYPEAKTYDFGPGAKNAGLFSTSLTDWASTVMSNAIRSAVTSTASIQ